MWRAFGPVRWAAARRHRRGDDDDARLSALSPSLSRPLALSISVAVPEQKYYAVLPLRCGNNSNFNRFVFQCGVNHCSERNVLVRTRTHDDNARRRCGRIYNKCRLRGSHYMRTSVQARTCTRTEHIMPHIK